MTQEQQKLLHKAAIEEAAQEEYGTHIHLWAQQRDGFFAGAQHVIDHPERYGLQKKITPVINTVPGCDFEDFHSKYSDTDE